MSETWGARDENGNEVPCHREEFLVKGCATEAGALAALNAQIDTWKAKQVGFFGFTMPPETALQDKGWAAYARIGVAPRPFVWHSAIERTSC